MYSYYIAPALALLVLNEELEHARPWRTMVLGGSAILLFIYYHATGVLWWLPFTGLAVALAWQAGRRVFAPGTLPAGRGE